MSQFLVIRFDRYDATNTTHQFVETDNHLQAFMLAYPPTFKEDAEKLKALFVQVNDVFASISDQDLEYLIYSL